MTPKAEEDRLDLIEKLHRSIFADNTPEKGTGVDGAAFFVQLCERLRAYLIRRSRWPEVRRLDDLINYWDFQLLKHGVNTATEAPDPQLDEAARLLLRYVDGDTQAPPVFALLALGRTASVAEVSRTQPFAHAVAERHAAAAGYVVVGSMGSDEPPGSGAEPEENDWTWSVFDAQGSPTSVDLDDRTLTAHDAHEIFARTVEAAAASDSGPGFPNLALAFRYARAARENP